MHKKNYSFYLILSLSYLLDSILNIGLIWITLETMGSTLYLGIILSLSAFIPFFATRYLKNKIKFDIKYLSIFRIIIFVYISVFILIFNAINVVSFLNIAILLGINNFLCMSTYQIENTKLVSNKLISKSYAAKYFQSSIQFGAFIGSFLGTFLLNYIKFDRLIHFTSICIILISINVILLNKNEDKSKISIEKDTLEEIEVSSNKKVKKTKDYTELILLFSLIGFHIGTFNIVIPVIFQRINNWNSMYFGVVDALAGIGALLAVFIKQSRKRALLLSLMLILIDIVLGYSNIYIMTALATFFTGFCISYISIMIRELIITLSIDNYTSNYISKETTLYYNISTGISPILISLIISDFGFGIMSARYILFIIAILIFIILYVKKEKN